MRVLGITQARIGSTRLPAKVLREVNGQTLLEIHLKRITRCRLIDDIVVATTNESGADGIVRIAATLNVKWYKGSLHNVLERFYMAARPLAPDYIVRFTSDCPLIDPGIVDDIIQAILKDKLLDYASNTLKPTYPHGMDVEVFKFSALEQAFREASSDSDREHVTPYIWRNSTFKGGCLFNSSSLESEIDYSQVRLTVDEPEDFTVVRRLIEDLGPDESCEAYVDYLTNHPGVSQINSRFKRNERFKESFSM